MDRGRELEGWILEKGRVGEGKVENTSLNSLNKHSKKSHKMLFKMF